ncbi:MAG: hypothetical protein JXR77_08930, partial [Lentisphaeria bacterium]|nr:hypothetical protein [Lentisphaeria bacterium]
PVPWLERPIHKWNGNPYRLDGGHDETEECGTFWLLPYWMGHFHGMIRPDRGAAQPASVGPGQMPRRLEGLAAATARIAVRRLRLQHRSAVCRGRRCGMGYGCRPVCRLVRAWVLGMLAACGLQGEEKGRAMTPRELALAVVAETEPLAVPRGKRLPLIVWALQNIAFASEAESEQVLKELDLRGIATVAGWNHPARERNLPAVLATAATLKRLGLPVVVNSTGTMQRFFDGDPATAHVDAEGNPFFDLSHSEKVKIGCPFALQHRYAAIREQVAYYVEAYRERDLPLDLVIADWEIDGPIEWNDSWQLARRCQRCRQHIPDIDENFLSFQQALRRIRCDMQRSVYAEVVRKAYPRALVGNYAEYPNDGWRYWYDYFEVEASAAHPFRLDGRERCRPWFRGFAETGYTFGMPVVYTWYRTFAWYDTPVPDYRWFYNMLKVATNAARSAPPELPLISFVHWHTTAPPKDPDPAVRQMSETAYQELLWHMLLRGHDGLAMWCTRPETVKETRLVQEVYAASQAYREFLLRGTPVCFDVPSEPGPVLSALRLGNDLLVRRTDFDDGAKPAALHVDGTDIPVDPLPGLCRVLHLGR